LLKGRNAQPVIFALMAAAALEIAPRNPHTLLWTAPAILLAAMLIAWAAESAQFFIAQGFALAILAWLQTMPEFAVEAVISWRQQVPLMIANLTGALRLLTGLGWPMIYATAAFFYRRRYGKPMHHIALEKEHSAQVIGLMVPLVYIGFIYWKATLNLWDAAVLIVIYVAYLTVLSRVPPQEEESIEELEFVPRNIVKSSAPVRTLLIAALFLVGGVLIYFTAEPFLGSLLSVSAMLGIPSFVFIQWVAPFVSEFPEKISAFYWARTIDRASMALMNMVSSNINQWTLLTAMLVIVYSFSKGTPSTIYFNDEQELEILLTLGQSLIGLMFLVNMELAWWEATVLFVLWFTQFVFSPFQTNVHAWIAAAYFIWAAVEIVRIAVGNRKPLAFRLFKEVLRGSPAS
jgi:cation:H+ antiporter